MEPGAIPSTAYVAELERAYGGPSQSAFGSAVFFSPNETATTLEPTARAKYEYFCGETWTRFGPENWLAAWKPVYARQAQSPRDVVAELRALDDPDARQSAAMLLDNDELHGALRTAFDDAQVAALQVYKIGDGGAMSGVLIAATRPEGALCLVFLLD